MSPTSTWQSSLSFSDRLSNVVKMQVTSLSTSLLYLASADCVFSISLLTWLSASSYRAASVSVDLSRAQVEAKSIEDKAYKSAKSKVSEFPTATC